MNFLDKFFLKKLYSILRTMPEKCCVPRSSQNNLFPSSTDIVFGANISRFRTRDKFEGHLEKIILRNQLEWLQKSTFFC